jgi:hypothetical protein
MEINAVNSATSGQSETLTLPRCVCSCSGGGALQGGPQGRQFSPRRRPAVLTTHNQQGACHWWCGECAHRGSVRQLECPLPIHIWFVHLQRSVIMEAGQKCEGDTQLRGSCRAESGNPTSATKVRKCENFFIYTQQRRQHIKAKQAARLQDKRLGLANREHHVHAICCG